MSRDDRVMVQRIGDHWYVLYGWGSLEYSLQDFLAKGTRYPDRAQALCAAHDLDNRSTEYGVQEFPPENSSNPY